jgi:phospholipid/cholesterol/gamma-HCH transport system substrate-binding protein
MDERVLRIRVGVVVLAALIATVILVMLFGAWPTMLQSQYDVNIKFPEAPGIAVDTPVRKSGVLIGRVSGVELLDEGGVLVSAKIFEDYKLRGNETCRIGTGSLLGDAILEFVPSEQKELLKVFDKNENGQLDRDEKAKSQELIGDGDYVSYATVASSPLEVLADLQDDIGAAFQSVESAGDEVTKLVRTVNQTVSGDEQRLQRIVVKLETALDRFDSTMRAVEKVVGDEELAAQLKQTLHDFPALVNDARQTMDVARTSLTSFQKASEKAEANLDNLEQLTRPLGERGARIVENVEASTENLNELLTQLVTFSESLNSGEGALGKLVRDDELYERIDRIVGNAEDLTRRLRPIVDDVRVFTDKIARDPSQLGVRGALDRRPSGLKTGLGW